MEEIQSTSNEQREFYVNLPLPETGVDTVRFGPNNPPWGGWAAFGVWFASIALLVLCPVILLAPYLISAKISLRGNELANFAKTDPLAVFLQILGVIPAHILTFVLAWFVVTRNRRFSFKEMVGWEWAGFRIWHAFAISIGFYIISIGAALIFGDVENDFDIMLKSSRYVVYLVAFFAVVTAPIVEEVVYRGLLFSAIQRRTGTVASVLIVTLVFAGVHAAQYSKDATPDYAVMIVLTLLSLMLTVLRAKTGNLLPCVVVHIVFNGLQSTIMLAEPFIRQYAEPAQQTASLFMK